MKRLLPKTAYQSLCHQILRNRLIQVIHLKKAPNTDWTSISSDYLKVKISCNWNRRHQISFPRYLDLSELYCQTFDYYIMFQMIPSVYDFHNIWTLDRMWLRILPSTLSCNSKCDLTRFPICAVSSDVRHFTQEKKILPDIDRQKAAENKNLTLD